MGVELWIFGALASLTVLAALGVVLSQNAIRSALCLVGAFFLVAVLYFCLGASFLGVIQIFVYAGAIMVLFLFVVMLLNLGASKQLVEARDPKRLLGGVLGLGLVGLVGAFVVAPVIAVSTLATPLEYGTPQDVGLALFTDYAYPLEAVSVLLLVGVVGSILLARRRLR